MAAAAAFDLATLSSSSSGGLLDLQQQQQLSTHAAALLGDVAEGLEAPVQLAYLVTLMGFLVVGAYLVVRQVSWQGSTAAVQRSSAVQGGWEGRWRERRWRGHPSLSATPPAASLLASGAHPA